MKNTKRKIDPKIAEKVYYRDHCTCVCCRVPNKPLDPCHHAYFGSQAQYDKGRNDEDRLVTCCLDCHRAIHFEGDPNNYRQKCKDYLINYYEYR